MNHSKATISFNLKKTKNEEYSLAILDIVTDELQQPDDGTLLQLLRFDQFITLGGEHTLLSELAVGEEDAVSLGALILSVDEAYVGDLQQGLDVVLSRVAARHGSYCAFRQIDRSHFLEGIEDFFGFGELEGERGRWRVLKTLVSERQNVEDFWIFCRGRKLVVYLWRTWTHPVTTWQF